MYKKPVVAILSTGNEIVDLHSDVASTTDVSWDGGGIFDTNRPSLRAVLEGLGYEAVHLGIVPDTCVWISSFSKCCDVESQRMLQPFKRDYKMRISSLAREERRWVLRIY